MGPHFHDASQLQFSETALRNTLALINCQCYCLAGNKRRQGDRMLSAVRGHFKSGSWLTLCILSPRIPSLTGSRGVYLRVVGIILMVEWIGKYI